MPRQGGEWDCGGADTTGVITGPPRRGETR